MQFDLDEPYPISAAQMDVFRRNGFVRLKSVFSADELRHYGEDHTTDARSQ